MKYLFQILFIGTGNLAFKNHKDSKGIFLGIIFVHLSHIFYS